MSRVNCVVLVACMLIMLTTSLGVTKAPIAEESTEAEASEPPERLPDILDTIEISALDIDHIYQVEKSVMDDIPEPKPVVEVKKEKKISTKTKASKAKTIEEKPVEEVIEIVEEPEVEPEVVVETDIYAGAKKYRVTAYCACSKCCGKSDGITASGAKVQQGVTIAMKGVPFGTVVYIEGLGKRIVQDRGVGSGKIDVYFNNHQAALNFGVKNLRAVIK